MAKKIPVTMKMDPELKARAEQAAEAEHRSFANFVDVAIREKLELRERTTAKPKP